MLHGIKRERKLQGPSENRGGVRRVVIRYTDGRTVNVVPDAERGMFSEDDVKEFKKILDHASEKSEWAELSTRPTM